MKRTLLKYLPYLTSLALGGALFWFSTLHLLDWSDDLLVNLSASFIAIPLVIAGYEVVRARSQKALNKEVLDFVKVKIDTVVLTIVGHMEKTLRSEDEIEARDNALAAVTDFLNLDAERIRTLVGGKKMLGFQIFKKWDSGDKEMDEILRNPFMLTRLEDEQVIAIIEIRKAVMSFDRLHSGHESLYLPTGGSSDAYRIVNALEVGPENTDRPNDYILLKKLDGDKGIVRDFGTFSHQRVAERGTNYYEVNPKLTDAYCAVVTSLIRAVNQWVAATGGEFLIDPQMFRIRRKPATGQ